MGLIPILKKSILSSFQSLISFAPGHPPDAGHAQPGLRRQGGQPGGQSVQGWVFKDQLTFPD